jgi:hypothetical protein
LIRGTGGFVQVLEHLSSTNDWTYTHLFLGNLRNLQDGRAIEKALQSRGFKPVLVTIVKDPKKGNSRGFGFAYVDFNEVDQLLNLAPPLMYEKKSITISSSIRKNK